MFIDARSLPDHTQLTADLAIIGGGPAGITLARALAATGQRICLIEAGDMQYDSISQAHYEGETTGISYPLAGSRMRFFGGSSNHWGGYCRPLEAIDFEPREWVENSGWPFTIDELLPWYGPACEVVEIGPPRFTDKEYWQEQTAHTLPELPSGRMALRFFQFSPPTHFGTRYGDELRQASNIDVLLNANVTNIAARSEGRSVRALKIATHNGLHHQVQARDYVLATGGLENARTLLLSNDVVAAGLGNQNDQVGRYFMEHPHLEGLGSIIMTDIARLPPIYRRRVRVEGRDGHVAFTPSDRHLREQHLLNATFSVGEAVIYRANTVADTPQVASHMTMLAAGRQLFGDRPWTAPSAPDAKVGQWLGIGCACEQVPNPDSRVMLADSKDAFDLPRIKLDWRLTEQDRHSVISHVRTLAMEIGALGVARMLLEFKNPDSWPEIVMGGSHHMGTTRMHDDPRHGVVDRNCKVHGCDNLYVAGSSVFPTSGAANPTLTIVALALRLADHLKTRGTRHA
ncbi:MAG: GMC family oxidoreductase [Gammaproteobacteria bacterium]|nr:GMC family oxidoreductase [Gammaproteobacteria bacterium]